MSAPSPKVEVEHLYKIFGNRREEALKRLREGASKEDVHRDTGTVVACDDVGFAMQEGEIFVVMGLSGSGKSTLIRCINRLIPATEGRVLIDGEDVLEMDEEHLRRVRLEKMSMVFQHFALFPHMTVGENTAYGLKIQGVDEARRRERALKALDLVGLGSWADAPPQNLSGGMQQRVGLARALAVDPELLLMDEPFSALDPLIRRDMQKELIDIQQRFGNSIIFITHDLHEALTLGTRIAIMKDGRFVQVGTPEEIVGEPADDYVAAFTQDVDRGRVFTAGTIMEEGVSLGLDGASPQDARERLGERDALHVVDGEGRPVGLVLRRDLERAAGEDGKSLAALMRDEFPTARRGAALIELYELCSEGLPVAVTDRDGRLRGTLDPLTVFRVLAPEGEDAERRAAQ